MCFLANMFRFHFRWLCEKSHRQCIKFVPVAFVQFGFPAYYTEHRTGNEWRKEGMRDAVTGVVTALTQ